MREIKFRGKSIEFGEWIYGDLIIDVDRYAISTNSKINNQSAWVKRAYEVIPESVGQYTCLKDKNDKEIYEGDVFEHNIQDYVDGFPREENHTKIVTYDNGAFWVGDYLLADAIANDSEAEVIGNIFEHSHLLEQHHD